MTNPAPADDITLPAMPELSYLGDDHSYGYEACDMAEYARDAVKLNCASPSRAAVPAPGDGIIAIGGGPAESVSAHATITKIIDELRTYSPEADEYLGRHILKGWANQLESVAPPHISETDEQYWLRHRSTILAAIEKRGFSLVSSGGLFWLSEKASALAATTSLDPEDCEAHCPRCDGSGEEEGTEGQGPDAYTVTINCQHCDGAGTLFRAYRGVCETLTRKEKAWGAATLRRMVQSAPPVPAAVDVGAAQAETAQAAPVVVVGKSLNAKAADLLRPFLKDGDKVIWREAFRWKDDDGVLSNHYDSMELESLAADFGYEIDWDTNFKHAAIVRAATPGATHGN